MEFPTSSLLYEPTDSSEIDEDIFIFASPASGSPWRIPGDLLNGSETIPYIYARDEKAYNVSGGSASSGWNVRDLNTLVLNPDGIASLASNQVTLPSGTYRVWFRAPGHRIGRNFVALWNDTTSEYVVYGYTAYNSTTSLSQTIATGYGLFVLSAESDIELHHYCRFAEATHGLGVNTSVSGIASIYSSIILGKEA